MVGSEMGRRSARRLLGDEGTTGGGETVAIVHDVAPHLGELEGPVRGDRSAPLIGISAGALVGEAVRPVARSDESDGALVHLGGEAIAVTTDHLIDEPEACRLGGADRQALLGQT